jgi:NUMOD3 motif-containing protein
VSQLVKSPWHYRKQSRQSTAKFLSALAVPYRIVSGQEFWESNREQLRELYQLMQESAREHMHELHPDTGGDPEQFKAFLANYRRAQDRFARILPSVPVVKSNVRFRATRGILSLATRQKIREAKLGRKRKPFTAAHRAKISGANKGRKYGEEFRQKCREAKLGRKKKPLTTEHRLKLSRALKGRVMSEAHRSNISRALTGRRLSADHCAAVARSWVKRRALAMAA